MYVIVWEFEVAADKASEFRSIYSPAGAWTQLFRQAPGFRGTELLESDQNPSRFLTIDRWALASDFAEFRRNFGEPYAALDARCEGLTLSERKLGTYVEADTQ
jgi:heme-degrading monooxygenase HmoA